MAIAEMTTESPIGVRAAGAVDEADLIARARDGDRDAFGELYARHRDRVHAVLRVLLRGYPEDVDDVAAEVFVTALLKMPGFDPERAECFRAWLKGIVRNLARSHLRRRSVQREVELGGPITARAQIMAVPGLGVEDAVILRLELADMLRSLTARRRLVLLLRDWAGWPYPDMARALGVSYDAVVALTEKARRGARAAAAAGAAGDRTICPCGCRRLVISSRRRFASRTCVTRGYQRRARRAHLYDRQPRYQRIAQRVQALLEAADCPLATRQISAALPDVDGRSVNHGLALLKRAGGAVNVKHGRWSAARPEEAA